MLHNIKKHLAVGVVAMVVMLLGTVAILAQDGTPENPVPMGSEPFKGEIDPQTIYTWAGPVVLFGRNGNSSSGQSAIIISSITTWKSGQAWTYLNSMTNLPWELCSGVNEFKMENVNLGSISLQCRSTTQANDYVKAQVNDIRYCATGVIYKLEVSSRHTTLAANGRYWTASSYYGILGTCDGE